MLIQYFVNPKSGNQVWQTSSQKLTHDVTRTASNWRLTHCSIAEHKVLKIGPRSRYLGCGTPHVHTCWSTRLAAEKPYGFSENTRQRLWLRLGARPLLSWSCNRQPSLHQHQQPHGRTNSTGNLFDIAASQQQIAIEHQDIHRKPPNNYILLP